MFDRDLEIEFIYNMYKDIHGVKPRHIDFESMSDEELDNFSAQLVAESKEEEYVYVPTPLTINNPFTGALV